MDCSKPELKNVNTIYFQNQAVKNTLENHQTK